MTAPPDSSRPAALRLALRLEHATVAWNAMEVLVTIGLGVAARSLALLAFGLDSVVEIFASLTVLWHLRGDGTAGHTRRALRLVAAAFFLLAAVLAGGAVAGLVSGHRADPSPAGVAYLALTAVVMFALAVGKRRVSARVGNHPLAHEARITFLDGLLATGILLALVLNDVLGWWWADPVAALLVAAAAVSEGLAAPAEH